jgi:hypothetical protein
MFSARDLHVMPANRRRRTNVAAAKARGLNEKWISKLLMMTGHQQPRQMLVTLVRRAISRSSIAFFVSHHSEE